MPDRLDLMISISIAPGAASCAISRLPGADDEIAEFVHAQRAARRDHCRRVQLVNNGRSVEKMPNVELFALIHRTFAHESAEPGPARLTARIGKRTVFI